ncbi:sec-independent protein translocase protein TatC [Deinococcus metalli]|uniref:Sec-independent protein translocase protein TatC n=1 Tax=Deinococcus metalli TaxID=1141878 RepID=A0A7W8KCM6_9DEIO|nr:twin-arginine translocase subunit TatC [Deinococcus metalli]MBB5374581.1 sec-independent protein translocase protein TatC [Deinococcus metalli]GHF35234.1 Sec-independent protein translocase protein TatC [Deinococcus metalli]
MTKGAELKSAPLFDHLDELRKRLIISVVFLAIAMAITFQYRVQLIELIKMPLHNSVMFQEGKVQVVTLNLTDQFMISLTLSFWAGLAIALPLILWQVWAFVAPGLYPGERRWALPFIIGAGVAFLTGALFGYELVLPAMVKFLLDFLGGAVTPILGLGNYIGQVTTFLVAFGLAFELPILAVILTKIGIVNHVMLRKGWRFALVAVMVAAAVITPTPDPGNMMLVAVPLYALYELGVLLSRVFRVPPPAEEIEQSILGT